MGRKLVAEDHLSDKDIASTVGIDPATLYRWKLDESFDKLVNDAVAGYLRTANLSGYALKRLSDREISPSSRTRIVSRKSCDRFDFFRE